MVEEEEAKRLRVTSPARGSPPTQSILQTLDDDEAEGPIDDSDEDAEMGDTEDHRLLRLLNATMVNT